jgi:hypothetical protein
MNALTMKAAQLNNRGAALLEKGLLEEASFTFKEALRATRDELNKHERKSGLACNETCSGVRSATPLSFISDGLKSGGSSFLVYRMPERICEECMTPNSLHAIPSLIVASILFNLSLTHHLRAIASPSAASYSTALQLYEHTYRLIVQDENVDNFLPLAVLNNVAHLQYKMDNLHSAELTLGLLWRAVLDREEQEQANMHSPLEGFCTNVIRVNFKHSQPAAAA